jgi:hypothetical protein
LAYYFQAALFSKVLEALDRENVLMFQIIKNIGKASGEGGNVIMMIDRCLENCCACLMKKLPGFPKKNIRAGRMFQNIKCHQKITDWQLNVREKACANLHSRSLLCPCGYLSIRLYANAFVSALPQSV